MLVYVENQIKVVAEHQTIVQHLYSWLVFLDFSIPNFQPLSAN